MARSRTCTHYCCPAISDGETGALAGAGAWLSQASRARRQVAPAGGGDQDQDWDAGRDAVRLQLFVLSARLSVHRDSWAEPVHSYVCERARHACCWLRPGRASQGQGAAAAANRLPRGAGRRAIVCAATRPGASALWSILVTSCHAMFSTTVSSTVENILSPSSISRPPFRQGGGTPNRHCSRLAWATWYLGHMVSALPRWLTRWSSCSGITSTSA
jgi:hypothetical protein